jgi:uncharacterized protein (TIGR00251 family)
MKIVETKEGSVLEVSVKPRSKEFKIAVEGDEIAVFCTEIPLKGRVNKELVKGFSRLFHKEVKLVSGFSSKKKKLLIRGIGGSDSERILAGK